MRKRGSYPSTRKAPHKERRPIPTIHTMHHPTTQLSTARLRKRVNSDPNDKKKDLKIINYAKSNQI